MEIYSMLSYNTIFFAECQDRNGFLFHFVNFTQTQVIFYSRLTSRNLPFFAFYVQWFSIEIIAEKAVLHLVTHHLHKRRSRIAALYTKKPPRTLCFRAAQSSVLQPILPPPGKKKMPPGGGIKIL